MPGSFGFRASSLFFFGFALAVAWLPFAIDPAMPVRWAVAALFAPAILFFKGLQRPLDGWGLVCLFCLGVGVAWSPFPASGLEDLAKLVILACVFLVGAARDPDQFWRGLAVGLAISVAVAIAQLRGWQGLMQWAIPGGLFVNKNVFAESGLVVFAAGLGMRKPWMWAIGVAVIALGGSKAVYGAAAIVVAMAMWKRAPRASGAILSITAIAAVGYFSLGVLSASSRLYLWALAVPDVTVMGHGLGSFIGAYPKFEHVHNEYLQLAFETGVLGLGLAALIAYLWGPASDAPEQLVLTGMLSVAFLAFPLHLPLTACAFAMALGCAARRRAVVRDREHAAAGLGDRRDGAGLGAARDAHAA